MLWRNVLIAVLVTLGFAAAASAVVVQQHITPESVRENPKEFSVKVEKKDDGLLHFTVVHKVKAPGYYVSRLTVKHDGKTIAESHTPAFVEESEATYYLVVAPEYAAESEFELSERTFGKSSSQKVPLPGGIDYRMRLRDFVTAGEKGNATDAAPEQTEKRRPEDKQGPAVSDGDGAPIWGEVVDGLQLAVSGIRPDRHFKSGDTIRFRLIVRNVGTETVHLQYQPPKMCDWIAPLVETNGERIQLRQMFYRGGHKHFTETLEPKAEATIHTSGILVLGASDTTENPLPRIEKPEPGEYWLRGVYTLEHVDADGKEIIERDGNGKQTVKTSALTSGAIAFHID
jgi:hypothetical protein